MLEGPKGKYLFGLVRVGEKGQIVITKDARDMFGIKPGDSLLLLGDKKKGLALVQPEQNKFLNGLLQSLDDDEEDMNL